jgi:putative acetyltransferase
MNEVTIRAERAGEVPSIRRVHQRAFPGPGEARLVEALRDAGRLVVSMVAELDGMIVGHIAFTPVTLDRAPQVRDALGLAPLAVVPDRQRHGIGRRLIEAGLEAARATGAGLVVVLGEPEYYARFGFEPAARWGLHDEYGGGGAFLARELRPGAMPACGGLVRYVAEFTVLGE